MSLSTLIQLNKRVYGIIYTLIQLIKAKYLLICMIMCVLPSFAERKRQATFPEIDTEVPIENFSLIGYSISLTHYIASM